MILYIITQEQWQEEDFGNLASDETIIHGIFRNKDKAIELAKSIKVNTFYTQFGESDCDVYVYEITSETKLNGFKVEDCIYTSNPHYK